MHKKLLSFIQNEGKMKYVGNSFCFYKKRLSLKNMVQDITLIQRNVSPSDLKISPSKSNTEKPVSVDFTHEKGEINIPQYNNPTNTTTNKKSLPSDIREHFEANSSSFIEFAKKKNDGISKKIEESKEEDVWDRALLFGEYPGGKIPMDINTEIKKNIIEIIPKKPVPKNLVGIFPNQFLPQEKINEVSEKKENKPAAPITISIEKIILPRFVPKKPEITNQTTNTEKKPAPTNIIIPTKPEQTQEKESIPNIKYPIKNNTDINSSQQEIKEPLQKKIIEGQMRGVFENAPVNIKETLEKMPVQDILSLKEITEGDQSSDYFWKRRLRDYIQKIKEQGKTTVKNPQEIEPKENETVITFIERLYSLNMKQETMES